MARCQDLDLYGFPLVGLTGREAAAIAARADDGKRMQRWRRQVSLSPWSAACITSWQPPPPSLHLLSHHTAFRGGSHLEVITSSQAPSGSSCQAAAFLSIAAGLRLMGLPH